MPSALCIFRQIATEFGDSLTDADVTMWMEIVRPLINQKRFGASFNLALALLAAHYIKMAGGGANPTGTVADTIRLSNVSEGEVSVGFSTGANTNLQRFGDYALTSYGVQYLSLLKSHIMGIISAGEG